MVRNAALRAAARSATTVVVSATVVAGLCQAGAGTASAQGSDCPALFALGVQGTGESSPDAPAEPTTDTGLLSTVFTPLVAAAEAAGVPVRREYIPYDAGFGGFVPGGGASFQASVSGAQDKLRQRITEISEQCSGTRIGLVGYSQGAYAVSTVAQEIGAGKGPVEAARVAGVALIGDPTRSPGTGPFPGSAKTVPTAAPGTSGQAIAALAPLAPNGAPGGGIGPERDVAKNFGQLTGRVASLCTAGDLSCDAPENAPLLKTVANIAGQAEHGGDPLAALGSIAQALAMTSIKTATKVINEDISGNSLASLSLSPKKSLSARLAEASDPRSELDPADVLKAVFKVGSIGLNAVITVAKTVLTPANIAEIAAAGLGNPISGLAIFGSKVLGALPQLMPPATGTKLIQQTFQAVTKNVTDNSDLLNIATWVKYSNVTQAHTGYGGQPVTPNGDSATKYIADWFAAVASDIASGGAIGGELSPPTSSSSTSRSSVPTSTPPTSVAPFDFDPTTTTSTGPAAPAPSGQSGGTGLDGLGLPGPSQAN